MKGRNYIIFALAFCLCAVGAFLTCGLTQEGGFVPRSPSENLSSAEPPNKAYGSETFAAGERASSQAHAGTVEPGYWAETFSTAEANPPVTSTQSVGAPREIEITVPAGARLPVAVLLSSTLVRNDDDGGTPQAANEANEDAGAVQVNGRDMAGVAHLPSLTPVQQQLTDKLATDFGMEINEGKNRTRISTDKSRETAEAQETWRKAAASSDERLRALLGHDQYNREIVKQYRSELPH